MSSGRDPRTTPEGEVAASRPSRVPTNDRGPLRRFLERVRAEPLHRTVEVLGVDVEQRRIRVVDVSVDGPICHAV